MFFCERCRIPNRWPTGFGGSTGTCVLCGKHTVCYDVPTKHLPKSKPVCDSMTGESTDPASPVKQHKIKVTVVRSDELPAFGGYLAGTLSNTESTTVDLAPNNALILLNVEAIFNDDMLVTESGEPVEGESLTIEERKSLLITTLMHEFGHVLEEHFNTEFSEDRIEKIVASWEAQKELQ